MAENGEGGIVLGYWEDRRPCCQISSHLRIHQNRRQLVLCPRPHWGSLQRLPKALACYKVAALR